MISIVDHVRTALSFFEIEVVVKDYLFETVDGEDKQTLLGSRTIDAAVDASNSRQLEKIFGGSVSDGDIGIYTSSTLHIQDQGETKQSDVVYGGRNYRVSNEADWTQQAGVRVYLAKRHVRQQ